MSGHPSGAWVKQPYGSWVEAAGSFHQIRHVFYFAMFRSKHVQLDFQSVDAQLRVCSNEVFAQLIATHHRLKRLTLRPLPDWRPNLSRSSEPGLSSTT